MRTLKIILGIGCFTLALLLGDSLLWVLYDFGAPRNIIDFCLVLFLATLTASLIYTGWFLAARRNLPISRNARIRLLLYFSGIGIFAAVALPNFIKARSTSCCNACINNLRQIDAAAQEFALEKGKTNGEAINYPNDLTPYINKDGKIPPCPKGGIYSINKVGDNPTCSLGTTNWSHVLP
jgi:hypothetical protein